MARLYRRLSRWCFLAMVLALPFQHGVKVALPGLPAFTLKASQIALVLSFALHLLCLMTGRAPAAAFNRIRHGQALFVLGLLPLLLVSTMTSLHAERSVALLFALVLLLARLLYSYRMCRSEDDVIAVCTAFVCSGSLTAVYGITQMALFQLGREAAVNFNPWDRIPRVPFFSNENYHSSFALIPCLLLVALALHARARRLRLAAIALVALNASALVVANSRGALVALAAGLAIQLVLYARRLRTRHLVTLAGAGLLMALALHLTGDWIGIRFRNIDLQRGTLSDRLAIYQMALESLAERPIFGIGLGSFEAVLGWKKDIHNAPLMLLTEAGVAAAAVFAAGVFVLLYALVRRALAAANDTAERMVTSAFLSAIVATLVQTLVEPFLYAAHIYVLAGAAMAYLHRHRAPAARLSAPDEFAALEPAAGRAA